MSPGDFLRSVWPSSGHYCIAWPFTIPNTDRTVFAHKVFDTISDAVSYVLQKRGDQDLYFAVLSLREREVFDPKKIDFKTGQPGAKAVRKQSNMLAGRALIFDIDVKPEEGCYHSRDDALAALTKFVRDTQLPWPTLVSSGGGFHVYWPLEDTVPADKWQVAAGHLKQLASAHGLKVDPARTTDTASVLRVPGTFNWKDRANPTPVQVLKQGAITPNEVFLRALSDALARAGQIPKTPSTPAASSLLGSNMEREYDGPPVQLKDLGEACKQVRLLLKTRGNVDQSAWYHGILNTVKYVTTDKHDGRQLAHLFSQGHPDYDYDETETKLDQLEDNVGAPARCETIRQYSPFTDACEGCPFANDASVPNPLVATRRSAKAPPPIVQTYVAGIQAQTTIPDPPAPFTRLKSGGIAAVITKGEDEVVEEIYPYDLYPVRRLVNAESGIEQHQWAVQLPREGRKEFLLDADALYDQRKFVIAIANQGIYPHRSYLQRLQEYMTAYISELQRLVDADAQCNHLGWSDDHTRFVLPDKILVDDGSVKQATLSLGAQRASQHIVKQGTLERQVELLRFYAEQQYLPNQFLILASLASPIFHMTGHHGVIINASGDAGASKSTSLYTAASFWGHPDLYPINGTNSGATVRGRNERVTTLANLPICVDEITHLPVKEAQDLAMGITQPGHRIRLETSGIERSAVGGQKSTMMLSTANNSLHNLLAANNTAGTAGSMRVFEIIFRATSVHTKNQADEYLHDLKENYGHVGEAFMAYVVQNYAKVKARVRAKMKEIDEAAGIQSGERFWSSSIAAVLVAGEIAYELGLLAFDIALLRRWVLEVQIPYARGIVTNEYSSPLAVLSDYLETINGNIIVVSKPDIQFGKGNIATITHEPRGALLAHYDTDTKVMYILKTGFRDYCRQIGANYLRVVDELHAPHPALGVEGDQARIILDKNVRRTLGAGTSYAKSQSWCFALNMAHPEVGDNSKLRAVEDTLAANDQEAKQA